MLRLISHDQALMHVWHVSRAGTAERASRTSYVSAQHVCTGPYPACPAALLGRLLAVHATFASEQMRCAAS